MTTPAERNLAAEVRAVEEGHRAFMQNDGRRDWVKVVSDTHHGKSYRVDLLALLHGEPITFTCSPHGAAAYTDDHLVRQVEPGVAGCKHAALAARRLEREGKAELVGGRWVATSRMDLADLDLPADPFEGL